MPFVNSKEGKLDDEAVESWCHCSTFCELIPQVCDSVPEIVVSDDKSKSFLVDLRFNVNSLFLLYY